MCNQPITTKAFYVPGLDQDLLGGRALIKAKYRMVLDEDPTISGIFPVTDGQIDPATGFPFAESEGLFYVETVPITESKYQTMSGYPLWHRRLSPCAFQTIKDTIPHALGLQEWVKAYFDPNLNCTACMLGKARLQPYPKTKEHAKRPLERVYMDIMSSSVTSIEGYNYALVITDDAYMYQLVYGLKKKSDADDAARKWVCDIVEIRARHLLQIVIRNNAGELKSQALKDYIESIRAKDYFSVAYEQWQNGLAESLIG